jgi:cytochrome P450
MMSFLLAMALHPDIMRKVQHEIDAVTGRDRLPTFDDHLRLPFVNAVCREVLRSNTVIPLGAPTSVCLWDIWTSPSLQLSHMQLRKMTFTMAS